MYASSLNMKKNLAYVTPEQVFQLHSVAIVS